jgi:hypothetical protein
VHVAGDKTPTWPRAGGFPRNMRRQRSDKTCVDPDPAPPLVYVEGNLIHDDTIHQLVCPRCWNVTAVWLCKPTAQCEVSEERFDVAPGVA